MFINYALIRFAKGSEWKIVKSVLFQLVMTLISSATILCMSFFVRALLLSVMTKEFVTEDILVAATGTVILFILIKLLNEKNIMIVTEAGVSIKDNVRSKIVQKMFLLGPGYSSATRTGVLTSTFTTRVEWLMNYYTKYMPVVVSAIINAVLFILLLVRIDGYSGVVALVSVLVMLFIPMMFFRLMKDKGKEEWRWHAKYYSECLDGIQGMISLKAFNADKKYVDEIKTYGENYRKAVMDHLGVTIIEGTFLEFFVRVGTALTIVILSWRCIGGYVDKNYLIIAFFAVSATFFPMLSLINAWHLGFQGVSGSYSIDEFLNFDIENVLSGRTVPKSLVGREELEQHLNKKIEKIEDDVQNVEDVKIQFKNVSFKYEGEEKNTVENIDFELKKGRMIALVGRSGAGKSTIAGLIMGFFRADAGSVVMNGRVLNNETIEYFHQNISAVWQSNHLFSGSVYDNIRIGKWDSYDEEIYDVAKKAMIHDLIMTLPKQYDTNVDELGGLFSTGERQRIAIARALLKDADFLLLDEATSSLDRENERYIQQTLKELKAKKGILVIAHRLQTIEMADEICFIQKGRIVARGIHEELLETSKEYHKLVKGGI